MFIEEAIVNTIINTFNFIIFLTPKKFENLYGNCLLQVSDFIQHTSGVKFHNILHIM